MIDRHHTSLSSIGNIDVMGLSANIMVSLSSSMSESFRRISIKGLLGGSDFEIAFSNENSEIPDEEVVFWDSPEGSAGDPLRLVYGLNGGGKTSVLRIIKALLEGDVPTLLNIPFESVEIERWEPWGEADGDLVPGGVEGAYLFGHDDGVMGNFDSMYNYMKFVTKGFGSGDWTDDAYPTRITNEQEAKIIQWLIDHPDEKDTVDGMSENGAFEFGMSNAHSHIFRLKKFKTELGGGSIEAEYIQNRNHCGFSVLQIPLLEILGFT